MERRRSLAVIPEDVISELASGDKTVWRREEGTVLSRVASASQDVLAQRGVGELLDKPAVAQAVARIGQVLVSLPKDGIVQQPRETVCTALEATVVLLEHGVPPEAVRFIINAAYNAAEDSPFGRYVG